MVSSLMENEISHVKLHERLILTTDGTVQYLLAKLLNSNVNVLPVVSQELISSGVLYRVVKFTNQTETFGIATSMATGIDREFFADVQSSNIGKAIDENKLMYRREIKQYYITESAIGRTYTLNLENGAEFTITEIFDRTFLNKHINKETKENKSPLGGNTLLGSYTSDGSETIVIPVVTHPLHTTSGPYDYWFIE